MLTTQITLLDRLRTPSNQDAWCRFVDLYTPLLFQWARRWGAKTEDAADLVQDVFTALLRKLPSFSYNPQQSFRAWLRTVSGNLWRDRQRAAATRAIPGDAGRIDELAVEADPSFEDEEYRSYLVGRALQLMQADFKPVTWRAVWEHAILGRPAAAVAEELGLTPAAVSCAKFRVLSRLRQELRGLFE